MCVTSEYRQKMENLGLDFDLNELYFTVHSTLVVKKNHKISGGIRKRNTNYLDKILMQCNLFYASQL